MKTVRKAQIENQHKISTLANPSPMCSSQTKGRHRVTMTACGEGGEGGIRTPGTLRYVGFQDRCIRPLCHLSEGRVVCAGRIVENSPTTSTTAS
jgi:hypothetical protein